MAARLSKLLKSIGVVDGAVMVTGGLAQDKGLVAALEEDISHIKDMKVAVRSHADSDVCGSDRRCSCGAHFGLKNLQLPTGADGSLRI